MNRWQKIAAVFGMTIGLGLTASQATAAVIYSYGFDQSDWSVLPGETIQVNVYLVETVTEGDTSFLVAENGLFSAQVTVSIQPWIPSDPAIFTAAVGNETDFNDWGGPSIELTPTAADVLLLRDIAEPIGVLGEAVSADTRRVLLGTLSVQAGTVIGQTTIYQASDNPYFQETVTFDSMEELDASIAPATFNVTVVPEPALLSLGALSGWGLLRRTRRENPA